MSQPAPGAQRDPDFFRLSKSKYLSGLQCHKRLYLEIHSPELATEPDEHTQAILDMGTEVGELARRRFPGGVLVESSHRQLAEALQRTTELLEDPTVPAIFEGTFEFDHVLVRVDILERVTSEPEGRPAWRVIEVKASTRVKDVHLDDLAIQTYVLRGAGLPITASCLMHVNNQYVYPGSELDLVDLFLVKDVTAAVANRLSTLSGQLAGMQAVVGNLSAPAIEPDAHCHEPYECPFWAHCTKDKPERWVYHLPESGAVHRQLAQAGIGTIDEIPDGFKLSIVQRRVKENVEWISPRLKAALESVRHPVHHLDFETFMPAIPRIPMTRPYQAIPTQWSNHIEFDDGQLQHDEYLCMEPKDPREEMALALLKSLGEEGTICVYSAYERHILESLANAVPLLKEELRRVMTRLWDLLPVIREHYYHPHFRGSYSIKTVLPALVPTLHYGDLEIQEGGTAAVHYYRMVYEEMDWVEKVHIREALLKYCQRDTLAMVEVRRVLLRRANEATVTPSMPHRPG